jgi:hypothetical protein
LRTQQVGAGRVPVEEDDGDVNAETTPAAERRKAATAADENCIVTDLIDNFSYNWLDQLNPSFFSSSILQCRI